jgi:flagellar hook-length control protein FliK
MAAKDNKSSGQGGLFNMSLLSASSFSQPMAQFAQKLMAGADNGGAIVNADLVDATTLELDADATTPPLDAASKNAPMIAMNKPVVIATTVRVGMPGWADQIAERTASLVSQNIKQAEIILNPQDMGTIHVKLTVSHDQAAITFVAQSAQVRELLDQSVQRLRDTLASDGVELIQSDVRDQQQFASDQQQQNERDHTNSSSELLADEIEMKTVVELKDGIDHFV